MTTLTAIMLGIILFYFCFWLQYLEGRPNSKTKETFPDNLKETVDQIIDKANQLGETVKLPSNEDMEGVNIELEQADDYKKIHNTPGGLKLLIIAGFTFLSHPFACHLLAKFIVE